MHGELPHELSVAVLDALGTGTGQAEGCESRISWMDVSSRTWFQGILFLTLFDGGRRLQKGMTEESVCESEELVKKSLKSKLRAAAKASALTKVHPVLLIPLQQPEQKVTELRGRLTRDAG